MSTKHKNVSIETKIESLHEVNKGVKSKAMIAKEYDIRASILSTWIQNNDSILKTKTRAPTRKRIRTAKGVRSKHFWTDVTGESRRLGQGS